MEYATRLCYNMAGVRCVFLELFYVCGSWKKCFRTVSCARLMDDMFENCFLCAVCGKKISSMKNNKYSKHRCVSVEARHILKTANARGSRMANPRIAGSDINFLRKR